ncbi:MAG: hypothetical protein ACTMHH_00440 [Nesterenkonia sp.]
MILKIAFGAITILTIAAGIFVLTGEAPVAAALAFGAAVTAAISLAFLIGRDAKKRSL